MQMWHLSHRADKRALPIADRHYNRQAVGSPLPTVVTAYYWAGLVQLRAALADTGESIARAVEKAKGG